MNIKERLAPCTHSKEEIEGDSEGHYFYHNPFADMHPEEAAEVLLC